MPERALGTCTVVADMCPDERDYDTWLETLTEASVRLDALQTAVTEVRDLCESGDLNRQHIIEVLERHGV